MGPRRIPDREGINPLTNESVIFRGGGKALCVVDGKPVGNATLEGGEILTTGVPGDVCGELAAALYARVFEDDRS
jgi:hypothetical protein